MKIYELTNAEVYMLALAFERAGADAKRVRFALDGGLKIKVAEGVWSAPFGQHIHVWGTTPANGVFECVQCDETTPDPFAPNPFANNN